jgi:hypothetical protein
MLQLPGQRVERDAIRKGSVISLYRNRYRVESTKLKGWDYTADGWYFVTLCTRDSRMRLSKIGNVALRFWEEIPNHSANAGLDAFVIMPNHLHGTIIIKARNDPLRDVGCRDVACNVSTINADIGTSVGGDLGTVGASGTLNARPDRDRWARSCDRINAP